MGRGARARAAMVNTELRRTACSSTLALHSSAVMGSRPHIWTQNQTPEKYAQPFRSVGSARGIYAVRCTNHLHERGRPSTQIQMFWCGCGSKWKLERRRLTEGRGAEAGHRAGHQGVGDLSEGQQARRVVPLPLLLLDEALQLLFEGLEEEKREED